MAAERQWAVYADDAGDTFNVFIPSWLAGQAAAAFGAVDLTKPLLPRNLKMRYITCTSTTTARHRKVHIGTHSATWWNDFGAQISIPDAFGTFETYAITGSVGEKFRRGPH